MKFIINLYIHLYIYKYYIKGFSFVVNIYSANIVTVIIYQNRQ
jgi:hypothetical protein